MMLTNVQRASLASRMTKLTFSWNFVCKAVHAVQLTEEWHNLRELQPPLVKVQGARELFVAMLKPLRASLRSLDLIRQFQVEHWVWALGETGM